ncbi:copper resistance CopC/CopD family protein [Micromonospora sediminimaris]|uniref:Transport integral membrane protein n=1 Tax=Micromonospora sediminimaris TaxID=547162 RepID=A0A9W5XMG3_9ACTN|nr:copper resistance protein CopC [Micromonospora sediminimaris]GIJ36107.1 transport integral membrane protein [Micromonospora sediminimaris]SFC94620.1 copper transport protein [Micromonospora sediminimaris]
MTVRTRAAALLGLVLTALCAALGPAGPAAAHAVVVATTPQRDEVLGYAPREVLVTFSETIAVVPGRVQVLAPDGKRINVGEPEVRDRTIRIALRPSDRPLGTYLVSYRVISADSHPVAGSFTFAAGAPSATPPEPALAESESPAGVLVPAAKYLGYLGLLLAVGPPLLVATMWPRRRSRRAATATALCGLGLVAAGTLGTWVGQAAQVVGAPVGQLSPADLRAVADSDVGVVLAARLALVGLAAALLLAVLRGAGERSSTGRGLASRVRGAALAAIGLAGFVTWPLAGHPVASPLPPVSIALGTLHIAGVTAWLGGLFALTVFLLRGAHERVLARILPAWSRLATLAVAWLVAAGLGQAVIELGRLSALWGSTYGRLLLAKAALLAGVLAVAAGQRRLIRRRVAATRPRWIARAAGVELAVTAVVLALTAVLVQTPPGRSVGTAADGVNREGVAQSLTTDLFTLQFDIYPAVAGTANSLHAYVYTPQAKELPVAEWTVTAALPEAGIEPITVEVFALEPHHGSAEIHFPVAGDWTLRVSARTSEIDRSTATTTVTIR